MDEASPSPGPADAEYCSSVLRLPAGKTESQLDEELLAKAAALGVRAALPPCAPPGHHRHRRRSASIALSASSASASQEQLFCSTASDGSVSAYLTPHSSIFGPPSPDAADAGPRQSKARSLAPYERYLAQTEAMFDSSKPVKSSVAVDSSSQSIFSVSTRKSLSGFRSRMLLRRKPTRFFEPPLSCLTCQNDAKTSAPLHTLPCGHTHCADCLRLKIDQASVDESKMPPRCCAPIPASTIQGLLGHAAQEAFLRAVAQFSTPREKRFYCPSASCGDFMPPPAHMDPKAPFAATCRKCHARVCTICKGRAHAIGKDCPEDLEAQSSNDAPRRKRCYKCHGLVERTPGSSHLTCACKAQFCAVCGGVWDPTVGCPNICNSEEEAGRRRRSLGDDRATADNNNNNNNNREAAEQRSAQHPDMQALQQAQTQEMQRFCHWAAGAKSAALVRLSQEQTAMAQSHAQQEAKLREEHAKKATHLEDRQIQEEMELRAALEQSERSIRVRIKHMEAYCEGLRRPGHGTDTLPPRVVTEQNLRDLGRQYNLRDGLDRQHQAKINMMRDRQAKTMEDLLQRQDEELEKLVETQRAETLELETGFARHEDTASSLHEARKSRLAVRCTLAIEVLCKELQLRDGVSYAPVAAPSWPDADKTEDGSTAAKGQAAA